MFNVDVAYTLQLVHHKLAQIESSETMAFLSKSSRLAPRSNTTRIGEHTYNIGPCRIKTLTSEQSAAVGGSEPVPYAFPSCTRMVWCTMHQLVSTMENQTVLCVLLKLPITKHILDVSRSL